MTISIGDKLPSTSMMKIGEDGHEVVALDEILAGCRVVLFAIPGAYTPTCTLSHLPSFVRNMSALKEAGIDKVICISVNDPFVMQAWSISVNAADAGIEMLADTDGTFTRSIGMEFSAPPAGLIGRSKRYTMLLNDGIVEQFNIEESPAVCEITAAETLISQIS